MEMSRQRMRSGVLEGSTVTCPHCMGTGIVRSVESMALHVLRGVEAEAIKGRAAAFTAKVPVDVAVYILNQKRSNLLDIEERYGTSVYIEADHTLKGSEHRVEQAEARALTRTRPAAGAINIESAYNEEEEPVVEDVIDEEDEEEEAEGAAPAQQREPRNADARGAEARGDDQNPRKRRRRRRRKKGEEGSEGGEGSHDAAGGQPGEAQTDDGGDDEDEDAAPQEAGASDEGGSGEAEGEDRPRKRRRRGRRGGRRNRRDADGKLIVEVGEAGDGETQASDEGQADVGEDDEAADEAPVLLSYSREDLLSVKSEAPTSIIESHAHAPAPTEAPVAIKAEAEQPDEPEISVVDAVIETLPAPARAHAPEPEKTEGPVRRGWWQRRSE